MSKSLEWSPSGISMRGYLGLIVISILAPVLLFAGILFSRYYAKELVSIEEQLKNDARELALGIDRDLQGQLYTLQALSGAQTIKDRDFEAFYQQVSNCSVLSMSSTPTSCRIARLRSSIATPCSWRVPDNSNDLPGNGRRNDSLSTKARMRAFGKDRMPRASWCGAGLPARSSLDGRSRSLFQSVLSRALCEMYFGRSPRLARS
jgi:hypothetical protein